MTSSGVGIGCHVVIGRFASEEQIAHTASYQIGLMATLPQCRNDRVGEFAHVSMIQITRTGRL